MRPIYTLFLLLVLYSVCVYVYIVIMCVQVQYATALVTDQIECSTGPVKGRSIGPTKERSRIWNNLETSENLSDICRQCFCLAVQLA
jgi:hypothetical protein